GLWRVPARWRWRSSEFELLQLGKGMALARWPGARAAMRRGPAAARSCDKEFIAPFDHRAIAEREQHPAQLARRDPGYRGQLGIAGKAAKPRALAGRCGKPLEPVG